MKPFWVSNEVMKIGMDVYIEDMPSEPQAKSWLKPNSKVGYFRDCYNRYSLANWLSQNIDSTARGGWGLEIFDTERQNFNTSEWRKELLDKVCHWLEKARRLRGKRTYVGYPGEERISRSPEETEQYIEWLEALVMFARLVNIRKSQVSVWA